MADATIIRNQRDLIFDTYNNIFTGRVSNPLQVLQSTINKLKNDNCNLGEISLLYSLKSDYLYENGLFDEAYKYALEAYKLDTERKEVLHSLINIYLPRKQEKEKEKENENSQNTLNNSRININPHEDDEKAKEYAAKLENLYPSDPDSLYVVAKTYASLGLYNDSLSILKSIFSKVSSSLKQNNQSLHYSPNFLNTIKNTITDTFIERYTNCPNDAHQILIKYLIELLEWKYNNFNTDQFKSCIEEIWERFDFILCEYYNDSSSGTSSNSNEEWNKIHRLLDNIPCSVPLSTKILNLSQNIFVKYEEYTFGIEFYTRLITEYQTYNDCMLQIHSKFISYHILYLNRAKLYQLIAKKNEMYQDIESFNTYILCNNLKNGKIAEINANDLKNYIIQNDNEEPIIETTQQIKKRRSSRVTNCNIMISPMPKQYRDYHLTPKSNQSNSNHSSTKSSKRKASLSSLSSSFSNNNEHKDEELKQEFYRVRNENRYLINQNQTLQSDLSLDEKEIETLKQQITDLTCNDNDIVIDNNVETPGFIENGKVTSFTDLQRTKSQLQNYMDQYEMIEKQVMARDHAISELTIENQSFMEEVASLQQQVKILKDSQLQNKRRRSTELSPKKNVYLADENKNKPSWTGLVLKQLSQLLIGFAIFVVVGSFLVAHFNNEDVN